MANNNILTATTYTDGSCNTQWLVGAWVAIVLTGNDRKLLSGLEWNTTHNRMELTAVIKAIEYVRDHYEGLSSITIFSDSQYVIGLQARREKLTSLAFASKKGRTLQNDDLLKELLALFSLYSIEFVKIKAHQKENDSNTFNIEADMLSRKMVRAAIKAKFT